MGEGIVFSKGVRLRQKDGKFDRRDSNRRGSEDAISNESLVHICDNLRLPSWFIGGAVHDSLPEPGVFQVDNSSCPLSFNGNPGASVKETFQRFKFGGANPTKQQVFCEPAGNQGH